MLRSRLPPQLAAVLSALDTSTATPLYQQGMLAAATRDVAQWEAQTSRKRMKVAQETSSFMSVLQAQGGLIMETTSPIDVMVFSQRPFGFTKTKALSSQMAAE